MGDITHITIDSMVDTDIMDTLILAIITTAGVDILIITEVITNHIIMVATIPTAICQEVEVLVEIRDIGNLF